MDQAQPNQEELQKKSREMADKYFSPALAEAYKKAQGEGIDKRAILNGAANAYALMMISAFGRQGAAAFMREHATHLENIPAPQ